MAAVARLCGAMISSIQYRTRDADSTLSSNSQAKDSNYGYLPKVLVEGFDIASVR